MVLQTADAAFESRYKTEHLRCSVFPALWVKSRVHEWIGFSVTEGEREKPPEYVVKKRHLAYKEMSVHWGNYQEIHKLRSGCLR